MNINNEFIELIDINDIIFTNEYIEMTDITIAEDSSFMLSNGIISHNSAISSVKIHRNPNLQGAYALKGKSIGNINGMKSSEIYDNIELKGLMASIGLKIGEKAKNLRYNTINITSDNDNDGYNITGLLINFFFTHWPELFEEGKIFQILTPCVVAKQNKITKEFYSDLEYNNWLSTLTNTEIHSWNISYKKGLAALEDNEYKNILHKSKKLQLLKDSETGNILEIWFGKDSNKRKQLISETFCTGIIYDKSEKNITKYLKDEYLLFAYYTIENRAIPSLIDGFKPVQRKIINESLRIWNNNDKQLKIFQLGGYTAANQKYHHSDASLSGAIINMVQKFKNNLSLFDEIGQFGTLRSRDAGAPRYIGTCLNNNFKLTYKDNNLIKIKYDEGDKIEPEHFLPIIPMVLINGSSGMAVGFATNILNRNPKNIISVCLDYLNGKTININNLKPYYNQFTNNIQTKLVDKDLLKWNMYGKLEIVNSNTVKIIELPPNYEFETYEKVLNKLIQKKLIQEYEDNSSDKVEYIVKFTRENLSKYNEEQLIELFKLKYSETENLNTLDEFGKLKKFNSIEELIKYFIDFRLTFYDKRKKLIIDNLTDDIKILKNKTNFLKGIISEDIKINKVPKEKIITQLDKLKFDLIDNSFNYLLNMSIQSLNKENLEEYINKLKGKESELKEIKKKEPKQMYIDDLIELKEKLK
jgi:DNA topoisomerase-2